MCICNWTMDFDSLNSSDCGGGRELEAAAVLASFSATSQVVDYGEREMEGGRREEGRERAWMSTHHTSRSTTPPSSPRFRSWCSKGSS